MRVVIGRRWTDRWEMHSNERSLTNAVSLLTATRVKQVLKKFVKHARDPNSRTRRDESCRMILNMTCYDEIGPNRYSQVRIYTCAPAIPLPSARVSS